MTAHYTCCRYLLWVFVSPILAISAEADVDAWCGVDGLGYLRPKRSIEILLQPFRIYVFTHRLLLSIRSAMTISSSSNRLRTLNTLIPLRTVASAINNIAILLIIYPFLLPQHQPLYQNLSPFHMDRIHSRPIHF